MRLQAGLVGGGTHLLTAILTVSTSGASTLLLLNSFDQISVNIRTREQRRFSMVRARTGRHSRRNLLAQSQEQQLLLTETRRDEDLALSRLTRDVTQWCRVTPQSKQYTVNYK